MENSATKLLNYLTEMHDYTARINQGASVGEALHAIVQGETQIHSLAEFWRLIVQTKDAVRLNDELGHHDAYLQWYEPLVSTLSLPALGQQAKNHLGQLGPKSTCAQFLRICADQIRATQARSIKPDDLLIIQEAAQELHDQIYSCDSIAGDARRTLLRLVRVLMDSVQSYRFGGAEELRKSFEQFLGSTLASYPIVQDFKKKSSANSSTFDKVTGVVVKLLALVKPAAEATAQIADLVKKFEQLPDGSVGGGAPQEMPIDSPLA